MTMLVIAPHLVAWLYHVPKTGEHSPSVCTPIWFVMKRSVGIRYEIQGMAIYFTNTHTLSKVPQFVRRATESSNNDKDHALGASY